MGVHVKSPMKRRRWSGRDSDDIEEGTRFCRVQFTDKVQSLPYTTKFETMSGGEYFRVIHDKQQRVCRICFQPGHILRECPDFKCHRCGGQGHYARECTMGRVRNCGTCHKRESDCECKEVSVSEPQDREEAPMSEGGGHGGHQL